VHDDLLALLLADPYFGRLPPKSTGVDYFNPAWIRSRIGSGSKFRIAPKDMQATLAELTAATISSALPGTAAIAVCGGGAYNDNLLDRLRRRLPGRLVGTTADWGIAPELVEAAAFAWFARERLEGRPTNAPEVTGARAQLSMGGVYLPPAGP
jgi:anhydro-N-acetylmuramic acid kinase